MSRTPAKAEEPDAGFALSCTAVGTGAFTGLLAAAVLATLPADTVRLTTRVPTSRHPAARWIAGSSPLLRPGGVPPGYSGRPAAAGPTPDPAPELTPKAFATTAVHA